MVKVSVIVPVKDDKRILDLIQALERQTFKNFEVLIADSSKVRLFKGKTKLKMRYFHTKPMTISKSLHFLAKKSKAKLIATTESDCIPSDRWLEELISEYKNDKTIIVGAQVTISTPTINMGNLLMPKSAFRVPHDKTLRFGEDTEWFFSLEKKGFKFKQIDKAVVRHYKNPIKRLLRSHVYGRAHAYTYVKHRKGNRISKSIAYQLALSFFSFITAITLTVYWIIYKIKFFMKRIMSPK